MGTLPGFVGDIIDLLKLREAFDSASTVEGRQRAAVEAMALAGMLARDVAGWAEEYQAACGLAWSQGREAPLEAPSDIWERVAASPAPQRCQVIAMLCSGTAIPAMEEVQSAMLAANAGKTPSLFEPTPGRHCTTTDLWVLRVHALLFQEYLQGLGRSRDDAIYEVGLAFGVSDTGALQEWAKSKNLMAGGVIPENLDFQRKRARTKGEEVAALRARTMDAGIPAPSEFDQANMVAMGARYQSLVTGKGGEIS